MTRPLSGILLTALIAVGSAVDAATLYLSPADQIASPTDVITLNLVAGGLGAGVSPSVGGFDVDIGFDNSRLTFVGYTLGADLGATLDLSTGHNGTGLIDLAVTSLELPDDLVNAQGATVVLATLTFTVDVLAPGTSTPVAVDDLDPNLYLGDENGVALGITSIGDGLIRNPTGVPLPASLWLLAGGLGLVGLGRRG